MATNEPHNTPSKEENLESDTTVGRQLPKLRYIFGLAIISTFVASFTLLIAGTVETFKIVFETIVNRQVTLDHIKFEFLEVIDVFLVATILYVIASGFYQLFLNAKTPFDPWLRVKTVGDLESKLTGVVITVLGVTGLGAVVTWDGESDLLPFGATVALLIAALAFFQSRAKHE